MRLDVNLDGAAPDVTAWWEEYGGRLTDEFPKAMVLPVGHSIEITRRGQRVLVALSTKAQTKVHVAITSRSAIIPVAGLLIAFGFYIVIGICSVLASVIYAPYLGIWLEMMISLLTASWGAALGLLAINKARAMALRAAELARETWRVPLISHKGELNIIHRVSQYSTPVPRPQITSAGLRQYCSQCGYMQDVVGANYCGYCGKPIND